MKQETIAWLYYGTVGVTLVLFYAVNFVWFK